MNAVLDTPHPSSLRDLRRLARWVLWEKLRFGPHLYYDRDDAISDALLGRVEAAIAYDGRFRWTTVAINAMAWRVLRGYDRTRTVGRRWTHAQRVPLDEALAEKRAPKSLVADDAPDADVARRQLALEVRRALATLPPRIEQVLRLRFGIGQRTDLTLEETGARLPWRVTRDRVRQIEAKGLRMLRHPSRSMRLRAFAAEAVR